MIVQTKLIVQCDFDGTITEEDESFLLLDEFANGNWRYWLDLYKDGKIPVGEFNSRAFAMTKADKKSMVDFVLRSNRIRPGFDKLIDFLNRKGIRLVIVSNGLDFYIYTILESKGIEHVEIFAARSHFNSGGLDVSYIGPDGNIIQDGFKQAYTQFFLGGGHRVAYIGNGPSDLPAAALTHQVFATGQLVALCQEAGINCIPFDDFSEVVNNLEL